MALFEGYNRVEGSRSNTALIKSGHSAPAEEWLLDPRFMNDTTLSSIWNKGSMMTYTYGGPGMEDITIPKGRMMGVSTPVKDFVTKKFKTVITLPGISLNNNTIGMTPYNLAKDLLQVDRFGGNTPSVITQEYVTLPYIPSVEPATMDKAGMLKEEKDLSQDLKMPWGAVIGKLEVGDYVKSTPSGRLTKWIKGTDGAEEIVGQCLACDLNAESTGWEKWVLWNETEVSEDDNYMNRSGKLPYDNGYPFDPEYRKGTEKYQYINSEFLSDPTGIPGLHDGSGNYVGFGRNETEFTDIDLGVVPDTAADGTLLQINAKDYAGGNLTYLQEGVKVKIGDAEVAPENITIDYTKGLITIKLAAADAGKQITGTYKAHFYGTPTYLDFKGVVGAMNILLHK